MSGGPRFGTPHHHLTATDSTNLRARDLAERGASSGTVVTAGEQSSGRGRQGRVWSAPPGAALLYSAILRPLDLSHLMLPLAVPVAVCDACEAAAPVRCQVKWPNDVWLEDRKLAGVLIEARPPEWAVIGVGVNVSIADGEFPADLRWPATSLGHGTAPEQLKAELDRALERWVAADSERVREVFADRDALRGRSISWEGGPDAGDRRGTAEGIDERGNLLVRVAGGGLVSLGSGEVSLRVGSQAASSEQRAASGWGAGGLPRGRPDRWAAFWLRGRGLDWAPRRANGAESAPSGSSSRPPWRLEPFFLPPQPYEVT